MLNQTVAVPELTRLQIGQTIHGLFKDIRKEEKLHNFIPEGIVYESTKNDVDDKTFFRYFYLPFVITDVFFDYVSTVLDLSRLMRISELKKASRTIKELKSSYEYYKSRHLDFRHQQQEAEHCDMMLDSFYEDFNREYRLIRFKISQDCKNLLDEFRTFLASVYMALLVFQVLRDYCREADRVIESYWGECENSILTKQAGKTYELLWQFTGDCNVLKESDMKTSKDRLVKSIKETDYFVNVIW